MSKYNDLAEGSGDILGSVNWNDPNNVYSFLSELDFKMLEYMQVRDIDSMIMIFDEILIKTLPYITSYMKNPEKEIEYFENRSDIKQLKSKMKFENTDHEIQHNNSIRIEMIKLLNKKRLKYSAYLAKAGLGIPMKRRQDVNLAILTQ